MTDTPIWTPSAERAERSNMMAFLRRIREIDPEVAKRREPAHHGAGVARQGTLGELQLEPVRPRTGLLEQVRGARDDVRLLELQRRDVDRHGHGADPQPGLIVHTVTAGCSMRSGSSSGKGSSWSFDRSYQYTTAAIAVSPIAM